MLVATVVSVSLPVSLTAQQVYEVNVHGTIELGLAPHVRRAIQEAEAAGASAILLHINTPGGRVDAAIQIVSAITATDIPVYSFVNPMAWSAGALIALATDSIFMGPASSIGAATPIDGAGTRAPEKIVSAMRAEFRALAELRGFDPHIAEAMVDEAVQVEGVVEEGTLLVLTAAEALSIGFSAGSFDNIEDLKTNLGFGEATTVAVRVNWAERVVRFLSNPAVAPILLSIGTLALIIEIKTGAFGLAGMIGLAALGAFFGSHMIVGLAGWEEVILLGIGAVALVIEVAVVPGFGVAGIISFLSIGSAVYLAMLGNIPTWPDVAEAGVVMIAVAALVAAGIFTIVRNMPNNSRLKGVFLNASTRKDEGYIAASPRDDLIGLEGVALTDLRPSGTAHVDGERLDVVTEGDFINKGARIRVIRSDGYRHVVDVLQQEYLNS